MTFHRKLIPSETQKLINFIKESIKEGRFNVFSGPLYDQKGRLRIPAGKSATREEIFGMNWLLDFINGEIPEIDTYGKLSDLSTGKRT